MNAYLPAVILLFAAAIVTTILAAYTWQRRYTPGALSFYVLVCATAFWSLAYIGELQAPTLAAKQLWAQAEYIGIVSVPGAWLFFALQYTGSKYASYRIFRFLIIEPVVILLAVWTNPWHYLYWSALQLPPPDSFPALNVNHGPFFWVHVVYSYATLILGCLVIIQALLRTPGRYRSQAVALLIGATLPLASNIIYITGHTPVPQLDLTPFVFGVSNLAFAWSMFRFHMFKITPIAYHTVVEGIGDAVIVLDPDGRVVAINPAAQPLFGNPGPHAIGRYAADLATWWPVATGGILDHSQEITLGEGDTCRYFDLRTTLLVGANRRNYGSVVVLRDITERVQTEQALRSLYEAQSALVAELALAKQRADAANNAKTEFISFISHELKTPMTAIRGYTDMISMGYAGEINAQQTDFLTSISSNIDTLVHLIAELNDIARLETGQFTLEYGLVDLEESVALVLHANSSLTLAQNQHVQFEIAPDAALVWGDRSRIIQILTNLVSNATKYTPGGGKINIHAMLYNTSAADPTSEPQICLSIHDTGVGINVDDQQHLFEKFFRAADVKQRAIPGTGLGLHITQRLVDLHGGRIWFESAPGAGTTFYITLPRYRTNSATALDYVSA